MRTDPLKNDSSKECEPAKVKGEDLPPWQRLFPVPNLNPAKGSHMKFKSILLFLFFVSILTLPSPSITQSKDPNKIYKVAILPFMIHGRENLDYLREGINDILTSRITVEERVVVIERSIVERALYEEKPMRLDEAAATKIGMRVGADFIVLGSITKIGEYISLDARLISISEEKPPVTVYTQQKGIDDVMVKIGNFAQDIGDKLLGGRTLAGRQDEPRGPLITHAFTVEKIKYGDILKVYIEAEDPDGKMVRIGTVVDQAGYGRYPISWVYLKPTDHKYFKGYLQWNTFSSKTSILSEGTPITLTVTVFDKSGNRSNAFTFPITFESGVKRASSYQVPSPFDQEGVKKLGSVDIELMDLTLWPH
jgi:TolB-like protein